MTVRIVPLSTPYTPDIETQLKHWMPPNAPIEPLALFRVMAHHPELMSRMRPLGAMLLSQHSTLPRRERELIILRVCALCKCDYEWGVHVTSFGQAVGLSPDQLTNTASSIVDPSRWEEKELLLFKVVETLHEQSNLDDNLFIAMSEHWSTQQILEILVLIGWYRTISLIANVSGVSNEGWAQVFL